MHLIISVRITVGNLRKKACMLRGKVWDYNVYIKHRKNEGYGDMPDNSFQNRFIPVCMAESGWLL